MGGLLRRKPAVTLAFALGVAAIAGIPPLNGYASRELIHESLLHSHGPVPFVAVSVGEVLTFAALARAMWLGFLRPRRQPYERNERLPAGMAVAFGGLAVLCVGFGVAPRALIGKLMAPAGAGFLQAGRYAATVLGSPKALAIPHIASPFVSAQGLASTAVTVVLGGLIARWWLTAPESSPIRAPIRVLRGLHTGSVNDYTAFAVTGLVVAMLFLEASR